MSNYYEPAKRLGAPTTSVWGAAEGGRIWFDKSDLTWRYWTGSYAKEIYIE